MHTSDLRPSVLKVEVEGMSYSGLDQRGLRFAEQRKSAPPLQAKILVTKALSTNAAIDDLHPAHR